MRGFVLITAILASLLAAGACRSSGREGSDRTTAGEPIYTRGTPEIVRELIEAHGGMPPWRQAPTVGFRDRWSNPDGSGWETVVTVEQDSRRAYLDFPASGASITWDGERAWSVGWEMPIPPRFLALLNYYFVCLPWLTQDPGVNLTVEGPVKILDDPTEYTAVRMTFDEGVGDTPDDYYVLYIDPETERLHGCKYVVTYEALLPEGIEHTPEHILVFEDWTTTAGLIVPTRFTIYDLDGSVYSGCEISEWSFGRPFDEARMEMPEDAVVDTSTP